MKIKKEGKAQLQKLPALRIKYHFVVPFMGLIDMLTMASFYRNPIFEGKTAPKVFFLVFAVIGFVFMYWGLMWKITADGKRIRVRPAFGRARELPFTDLTRAVIHKKKKTGSLVFYQLIDRNGKEIVKIYPLMKDSSTLLDRLKRLNVPIFEESDR